MMLKTLRLLTAIGTVALLTACHSIPLNDTNNTNANTNQTDATSAQAIQERNLADLNDPNNPDSPLNKQSIYFGFDQFTIGSDYESLLRRYAQFMLAHPEDKVTIEGNTDSRGSSEYNLALGQKRANAVQQALNLLGVPDSQMQAISFGKEKPVAIGENPEAWAKNRRADLVLQH